ncbi:hypothetical protein A2U01_0051659, partial [Trifolium medium]|nr:hypothetical protein [Trifolium medium]
FALPPLLFKVVGAATIAAQRGKNEVTTSSRVGAAQTSDAVGADRITGAIADRIGVDADATSDSAFLIGLTVAHKLWFAGRTK